jgi:glucuronoarabinoxylan endo-1,4-beta-xylanase
MMKNKSKIFNNKYINKLSFILVLSLIFSTNLYAQNAAVINLDSTHQMIRGFGAANILQWRPDMTASEIETAFGTGDGQLGFTILRLRIQPQKNLWSTNVPTAKAAYDMGVTIFASPWNAPDEMVETVGAKKRIRYDMYEEYAAHLDSFNTYMANNDVPVYSISVQNEPDWNGGWTQWTAGEMLTFMKDNTSAIGTKVIAPESFQFRRQMSDPILNDSLACANLDIVGGHIYGGGLAPYPLAESKGKEIWMTEHYTDSENSGNLWPMALDVGTEIHNVMTAGMSAYVWWYIVRYYGPISDGTMDSGNKGDVTKRGYIMSQYSRFIRPGYFRTQCTSSPQINVFTSAYRDSTSSNVVIVAVNTASQTKNQTFVFQNGDVEEVTPFVTSETKNCSKENDIIVSNDSLNVTLDAQSVMTFVSGDIVMVDDDTLSFKLYQNYPNPFNKSVQINFEIPKKSFISLKVYNLLGQEVAVLAEKEFFAGVHSVTFDASNLANGIYFYTLRSEGFIDTKKMFIVR